MKTKLPMIVFVVLGALALLGGTWQLTPFAVTVPEVVPTAGIIPVSTPVSGINKASTVDSGGGSVVEITNLAVVSVPPNTLPAGTVVSASTVSSGDVPDSDSLSSVGSVIYINMTQDGVDMVDPLSSSINVVITLSEAEAEAFMKNPDMGIQWYDPEKKEWVKIPASLVDGKLTFQTKRTGYFAFASQK